ncbi:hypothetical protein CNMCM8980_007950 [Aspergillus fumigatiaffinis]|nr:hypothetical protein CNMCM5878_006631 [Aspergillus fumigatiaffinis]KAF4246914.1 hypothetical protein CNMCM8980_007950 [Aspergillus fumigatiaffinis]
MVALIRKRNEPSSRTPHLTRRSNFADCVELDLEKDGHRTWGFVMYRCTYKSDADWDEFMRRLRIHTEKSMESYNGLDMMDRLVLTVFDDRATFDCATTSFVREHFKKWAATAPQEEQGAGPGNAQRYRYCIQVTDECLNSIIRKAPPPDELTINKEGFVNIIDASWEPYSQWDGDERIEDDEEPLEGCTLLDVGWMRVNYDRVMTGSYYYLRNSHAWDYEYRRPPQIVQQ